MVGLLSEDDLKRIKNNRLQIMGFATLWIMLFHLLISFKGIFESARILGYGGVDIFMFLSGISMYQSFAVTLKRNIKQFYWKRLKRIVPEYLAFIVIGFGIDASSQHKSIISFIKEDTLIKTVQKIVMYKWFVPCILFAYFITPLIDRILVIEKGRKQRRVFLIIAGILIASIAFWNKSTILMMIIRIPLFILGYYCNFESIYLTENKKRFRNIAYVALVLLTMSLIVIISRIVGDIVMAEYGIWWYPWIIIAVPFCILISYFFEALRKRRIGAWIGNAFAFLGTISFEVYLWQWIFTAYMVLYWTKKLSQRLVCFVSIPITIMIAFLYKKIFEIGKVKRHG